MRFFNFIAEIFSQYIFVCVPGQTICLYINAHLCGHPTDIPLPDLTLRTLQSSSLSFLRGIAYPAGSEGCSLSLMTSCMAPFRHALLHIYLMGTEHDDLASCLLAKECE